MHRSSVNAQGGRHQDVAEQDGRNRMNDIRSLKEVEHGNRQRERSGYKGGSLDPENPSGEVRISTVS